jgi:hypothetical protein
MLVENNRLLNCLVGMKNMKKMISLLCIPFLIATPIQASPKSIANALYNEYRYLEIGGKSLTQKDMVTLIERFQNQYPVHPFANMDRLATTSTMEQRDLDGLGCTKSWITSEYTCSRGLFIVLKGNHVKRIRASMDMYDLSPNLQISLVEFMADSMAMSWNESTPRNIKYKSTGTTISVDMTY